MGFVEQFVSTEVPAFILARGAVYPGHEKAPFVPSGKGFKGCLSYNPDLDLLQCHECGQWFESLASHLKSCVPGLSVREYKRKHFLRQATSLINRSLKKSLAEKARIGGAGSRNIHLMRQSPRPQMVRGQGSRATERYEARNIQGTCHAQLIAAIGKVVQECGRTPSTGEFAKRGLHLHSVLDSFGVKGVPELMDKLGHGRCTTPPRRQITADSDLLDELRDFYVARGRLPVEGDWGQGMLHGRDCYRKRFGSVDAAFEKAGLGLVFSGRSGVVVSDEAVFAGLRTFWSINGRLPKGKEFNKSPLPFNGATVRNRFGSIHAGMKAAGIDIGGLTPRSWHSAWVGPISRQSALGAFGHFIEDRGGELPTAEQVRSGILGFSASVVQKHFGTTRPDKMLAVLAAENQGLAKAS